MNLMKRLRHLSEKLDSHRAYGKTTMLVKAAKEIDAVLLVASTEEANRLFRTYKVVAKSMDINTDGLLGPFLIDNHAVSRMFTRAADKIEALEEENNKLKEKLGLPTNVMDKPDKRKDYVEILNTDLSSNDPIKKKPFGFEFGDY